MQKRVIESLKFQTFQVTGLMQLILLFVGMLYIIVMGDPRENDMMLFL
jgi:hypothetical protein